MKAAVAKGGTFRSTISVTHPDLRTLMCLQGEEELYLDSQVSLTEDPYTLQNVYVLSQVDVTATVLVQRQLQVALGQLAEEKVRICGKKGECPDDFKAIQGALRAECRPNACRCVQP